MFVSAIVVQQLKVLEVGVEEFSTLLCAHRKTRMFQGNWFSLRTLL